MTATGHDADWMDLPFLDAQLLELRRPLRDSWLRQTGRRILLTKRMRGWISLQLPGLIPGRHAACYIPVGYYHGEQVPRVRVDTPSAIDTYARIHVDIRFILPPQRIIAKGKFRPKYSPADGLVGWKNRLLAASSETLPRRSATAQCILELHKHSPDPAETPLYFVRELRFILSSRSELKHQEALALVRVIDAVLLEPLVKLDLADRAQPPVDSLLTGRLTSPQRDSGLKSALPPIVFHTWDDFEHMNEADRLRRYEEEAKATIQNGLLSRRARKHIDGQEVAIILRAARGRCHYCKSLAIESRPPNWQDTPSLWAPIGRRIGMVAYQAVPSATSRKSVMSPIWCCLWCNTWPDERNANAVDHGGHHPVKS